MKSIPITRAGALILALGLAACQPNPPVQTAADTDTDAARTSGDHFRQSRELAVQSAREAVNGIEKEWRELQTRAAPATESAKADLQKAGDQMSQALTEAKVHIREAREATGEAWQQKVKPELDSAVMKAQKLYDDTAAKFNRPKPPPPPSEGG